MGFFSELKDDLSQAVNELMPEEAEQEQGQTTAALSEEVQETPAATAEPEYEAPVFASRNAGEEERKMDVFSATTTGSRAAADETASITAGMVITGDITSEGSMDLIGTINGNINVLGKLNVTGTIHGNSKAAEVYAEGAQITGEIVSEGSVKIGQSSVIIGNITATSAVIAGAVKGDIDVKGPVVLDTSAIVMGNIKSKSVQINNGAVIEGMCSQCYADVSPTSFFSDMKKAAKKA